MNLFLHAVEHAEEGLEAYLHILKHSAIDSLKVLGFAFIIYVILSFFEGKITNMLKRHKRINPILGASAGLIPQCGISVIAADLYLKKHITMGTLIAVFFACSDEALPILLSDHTKALAIIPLIIIKFVMGFLLGFLVDLFIDKREAYEMAHPEHHHEHNHEHDHDHEHEEEVETVHVGCCHHHIEEDEAWWKSHLMHPFIHSLKIFGYVFIVNLLFGLIIHWIGGEEVILDFLGRNKMLSPLVASLVGLIPNCASSVLITEIYLLGGLPFAGLIAGLSVNSGLGLVYLIKNRHNIRDVIIILSILFLSSVALGYIILGIMALF